MMLNPTSDAYVKTILCNVLVFNTQLGKMLPPAKLFLEAFSLFNEEVGEMSFSVLSRLTKPGDLVNMDRINKLYVLVHEYVSVDDDLMVDNNTKAMRNGFSKFDKDSQTANAVQYFLKGLVRRLKYNRFQIYDGARAFGNPNFMPKPNEEPVMVPRQTTEIFWVDNIEPNYKAWIKKLERSLKKPLDGLRIHWPQFFDEVKMQELLERNQSPAASDRGSDDGSGPEFLDDDGHNRVLIHASDVDEDEGDDENLKSLQIRNRHKKLLDILDECSSTIRNHKVGKRVWSIDPPDPGEDEDKWGIFSGVIERRAIRGGVAGAEATPAFHERVLCDSLSGPPSHYDVNRKNLDVTLAHAVERLNNIKRRLNIAIPETPAPLIVRRERTQEELARLARIHQLAEAAERIDNDETDEDERINSRRK